MIFTGLTADCREQILAVQRMQDYIREHLYEHITPADLSRVSLYSPWYSYRIFIQYTNYTPADYIRRIRLSESALRLRDSNMKIIDIAFDAGYGSVDGYQRAFFREFGCNPREYSENPLPLWLFTPYRIEYQNEKEEKCMENVKNVFISVEHKPARKVLVRRGIKATEYFEYCEEVGCDIWGLLKSMKSLEGEPVCMWLTQKYIKPGTSSYVQGVEVSSDYNGSVPSDFDIIDMPACDYLRFNGEPFAEEDYESAISALQTAIDKYSPDALGYVYNEDEPRIQLEPVGARGYIELLPIKKK